MCCILSFFVSQCPTCASAYERTCSDSCRTILRAVEAEQMSFADLPPHPGQLYYRRRVGLAATMHPSLPHKATTRSFSTLATPTRPTATTSPIVDATPATVPVTTTIKENAKFKKTEKYLPLGVSPSTSGTVDTPKAPNAAAIESYCVSHSTPPASSAILESITSHTRSLMPERANMLSDSLVGGVLRSLATASLSHSTDPCILELGTFTGYATSWLLDALPSPTRGTLLTCEINQEHADIALHHLAAHPNYARLQVCVAPAMETLQAIVEGNSSATSNTLAFDFIYLDANKKSYLTYFELILTHQLLKSTGLMVVDNTLWKGRVVAASQTHDSMTRSMDNFNKHIAKDTRVITTMLPIRDGITIVQWRQQQA
jgi:caffeoyl-CoA O-methyltransferase